MIQDEEYDLFLNDIENMPVFIRFYRATERLIKTFEEYQIEDDSLFIKGNELLLFEKTKVLVERIEEPLIKALERIKKGEEKELRDMLTEFLDSTEPYV